MPLTPYNTRPRESVKVLYDYKLGNAPGKSIVGIEVSDQPNGFTPPHRHASATVMAHVTEGHVLGGMNGNPPMMYGVGESFAEMPRCHHTVSENSSTEHPAKLVAVFVVDTEVLKGGYGPLTVIDEGYR
ncbi:hypothetical protein CSOJ01_09519 [Colletotrichum sojae]|uniref:Cupin type-2 domain-containing protein n=1 Tax=Colletotrichum sojae TaxID=2175907 RepID=A0A8H6MQP5_9PEZI|nr:hypothetical protein CSOJ01_09519 [Colletotrichum sojae]